MESLLKRSIQLHLSPFQDSWFWLVDLENILPEETEQAKGVLDQEDLKRASKFIFEEDRSKCILTYSILKLYLSRLINESVECITFLRTEFGKPYLYGDHLQFNLSHTKSYAFLGIHPCRSIGVDIEKVDHRVALLDSANSFIFPSEKKWLFNTYQNLEEGAFTLWCAKEAFLKALGTGFSTTSLPLLKPIPGKLDAVQSFAVVKDESLLPIDESKIYVYDGVIAEHKLAVCIV